MGDLLDHVKNNKIQLRYFLVQDPESIATIAPQYHDYNQFRMMPENILQRKIKGARISPGGARSHSPVVLGCTVQVTEAQSDNFIRNAQIREILPPQAADPCSILVKGSMLMLQ